MSEIATLPPFVHNSGLFQPYYLIASVQSLLPLSPEEVAQGDSLAAARDEAQAALAQLRDLWHERAPHLNASEGNVENFVAEVCRILGMSVSSQGQVRREGTSSQRVDLALFANDAATTQFVEGLAERHPVAQLYDSALAIVEVKRVGKDFAPKGDSRDSPVQQLVGYLTSTGVAWGILTDGHRWRIYRRFDPPRFDLSFEINLADILEIADSDEQLSAFWWFYACFHRSAFDRTNRHARLDIWYRGSIQHAIGVQESLRDQAFLVVEELARGIYTSLPNPNEADLVLLYEQATIILFRLLFLKFAEDRELLPLHHLRYQQLYGYTRLQDDLLDLLDHSPKILSESAFCCVFWYRLKLLFENLNTGNPDAGIFAYNGGLFRPERVEGISIPDAFLARAIAHLVRIERDGKSLRVSYRDLETRHLGSIYESLLEQHLERTQNTLHLVSTSGEPSNQRRTSGSYYTPDYIVDYMVQQVLDPLCIGKSAEEISDLSILDPSMGSGHFLVTALHRLAYHHAKAKNRAATPPPHQQPEETDDAFAERMQAYDIQIEPTNDERAASGRALVERCIYGVDLNPLAVELAKLALWLSTLAKERALSFLDHHVRVGNSLVGARIEQLGSLVKKPPTNGGNSYQMSLFEQVFWRVRDKLLAYFQQIADLPSTTQAQIQQKEQAYEAFRAYSKPFRLVANLWASIHFGVTVTDDQYEIALAALDDAYGDVPDSTAWHALETQPWFLAVQEVADYHQFFHWELEFPNIFLHNGKGFDVAMGNPPYVRQETLSPFKSFFASVYPDIYHGVADLYVYFIGQGIALLRQGGWLTYINSNKWFRANYGKKLRTYVPHQLEIERIIDFGDAPIFADAITYPSILVARLNPASPDHQVAACSWKSPKEELLHFADIVATQSIHVAQANLAPDGWRFEMANSLALLEKLRNTGKPFDTYVQGKFYRGILTGLNEAFVVDRATRDRLIAEHPSSADLLKPYLRGRDVKRWRVEFAEQYVIFTRRGIDITQYPAILAYLTQYKDQLTPGGPQGRKKGNYQWYELQDTIEYWQTFEQPKIIYPDIAQSPEFAYDQDSYYAGNTLYLLPTSQLWLLALLNSNVVFWFYTKMSSQIRGGFVRFIAQYVSHIPIPNASANEQDALSDLAAQLRTHAQKRYELQAQCRHRIQSDLGSPGRALNQKLSQWWNLDFATFRAEVTKALGQTIPVHERDDWEQWLQNRQAQHTQYTDKIVQLETALNQQVYALYQLSNAEIEVIVQETQYAYGK